MNDSLKPAGQAGCGILEQYTAPALSDMRIDGVYPMPAATRGGGWSLAVQAATLRAPARLPVIG